MPSKFKKAIAAVKDQTSISLAKVGAGGESSSLEVAILKATTHDETPVDERYVTEVLQRVSSNRCYSGPCARAIGRRVGRTRSWVVAVKSLVLVLRILQDGDPHFPKEVYNAMKRGYKILNLSSFRDDSSTSCPWDFTAFVRTFALYLDERLDCFLTGKLQRRISVMGHGSSGQGYAGRKKEPVVRDMKPSKLLDKISHWQKLLDRAIATQPTGAARTNRLVQTCLYAVVQETFDLYRDISDGLALLLDSFFHLQYDNCVRAYQTCVKASKQFEELCSFYELCKSIGVGRSSEYPSVNKVSEELLDTLQEFLKDQSSFPSGANGRTPGAHQPFPSPSLSPDAGQVTEMTVSDFDGSHCTSLEDLMDADAGFSPERYSDPGGEKPSLQLEEFNVNDTASVRSDPTDNRSVNLVFDLLSLDDERSSPPEYNDRYPFSSPNQGWELALFEGAPETSSVLSSMAATPEHVYNNPFLLDPGELNGSGSNFPPTFKAEFGSTNANSDPSFSAGFPSSGLINSNNGLINSNNGNDLLDLFGDLGNGNNAMNALVPYGHHQPANNRDFLSPAPTFKATASDPQSDSGGENSNDPFGDQQKMSQQSVFQQQQMWLQNQNKIMAKLRT